MTALITSNFCLQHEMQDGHPERPERLSALMAHLDHCGLLQDLDVLEPQEATNAHLSLVHKNIYLTQLNECIGEPFVQFVCTQCHSRYMDSFANGFFKSSNDSTLY